MLPNILGRWAYSDEWPDRNGCIQYYGRYGGHGAEANGVINSAYWLGVDASFSSKIYKTDWNEVTPTNLTFKIWKRIN